MHELDERDDPAIVEARRRWRAAGDRLWPIALSDGEAYREVAAVVGALVEHLRARVHSLADLVEARASAFPDGLGAAGARAARQPDLFAAACAVRADELAAAEARLRRCERIAEARGEGRTWVVLDATPQRTVEMHLVTGRAVVATVDPYSGAEPFRVGDALLDTVTGDPLDGPEDAGAGFTARDEWEAERERRRGELSLDSGTAGDSDRG